MVSRVWIIVLIVGLSSGCVHPKCPVETVNHVVAPYEQFVAKNIDWSSIKRVVLMPLANQTAFPTANPELQANLAAEFQRAGRFEIVVASLDDHGSASAQTSFRDRPVQRDGHPSNRSPVSSGCCHVWQCDAVSSLFATENRAVAVARQPHRRNCDCFDQWTLGRA